MTLSTSWAACVRCSGSGLRDAFEAQRTPGGQRWLPVSSGANPSGAGVLHNALHPRRHGHRRGEQPKREYERKPVASSFDRITIVRPVT